MKKLIVVGRGTVGCFTVAHFLRWTDWEIEWMYDSEIKPAAVGEGTTLTIPRNLHNTVNFMNSDMSDVQATLKLGIWKRGWGEAGTEFYHSFPVGHTGMHFNALVLQEYLFEKLIKNPRVTINENNVTSYDDLDSDYVMVCTGSPNKEDLDKHFNIKQSIPVNSCKVFHSPWDFPKFDCTVTFARQHGWVFGIPLQNRCSVGYLYNKDYATEEEIESDVQDVLKEFNLTPNRTNKLSFNNYVRKRNFNQKVCYNGNSSFFLEPLEATSTTIADDINRLAYDMWCGNITLTHANERYNTMLSNVESMICMHYMSGSSYKNKFWEYAKSLGTSKIQEEFKNKTEFFEIIKATLASQSELDFFDNEVGTWNINSYKTNIKNLGIVDQLTEMIK